MASPRNLFATSTTTKESSVVFNELVLQRKCSGVVRLNPSHFKSLHRDIELIGCELRLGWTDCMRIIRTSRVVTDGLPASIGDISALSIFKKLESNAPVLIIAPSYQIDDMSRSIERILSAFGLSLTRKIPSRFEPSASEVFIATIDEWAEHVHLYSTLVKGGLSFVPYVILSGFSSLARDESKVFPMFFHLKEKGVLPDRFKWMPNLLRKWDHYASEFSYPLSPDELKSKIENFISTIAQNITSEAIETIRMSVWFYAWAKTASLDNHQFCIMEKNGRVSIKTPDFCSDIIPELPMIDFMSHFSQFGAAQSPERIRCLMQLHSLSAPTLLEYFSNGFAWVGAIDFGQGIRWKPNKGTVDVFKTYKTPSLKSAVSEFILMASNSQTESYLSAAIADGDIVFAENPGAHLVSLGVRELSTAEAKEDLSGKNIIVFGVITQAPLEAILHMLKRSKSVRLMLDDSSVTLNLTEDGYLDFKTRVLDIGLMQSRKKPFYNKVLSLYSELRRHRLISSDRLSVESVFYNSVMQGKDPANCALEAGFSRSISELQGRLRFSIGCRVSKRESLDAECIGGAS